VVQPPKERELGEEVREEQQYLELYVWVVEALSWLVKQDLCLKVLEVVVELSLVLLEEVEPFC